MCDLRQNPEECPYPSGAGQNPYQQGKPGQEAAGKTEQHFAPPAVVDQQDFVKAQLQGENTDRINKEYQPVTGIYHPAEIVIPLVDKEKELADQEGAEQQHGPGSRSFGISNGGFSHNTGFI